MWHLKVISSWNNIFLYLFYTEYSYSNMIWLLGAISPRILIRSSEIRTTYWIWSLDNVWQKSEFFKKKNFLAKNGIFYPKMKFFIRVDILISCPSLSRVMHNSSQKLRKIRHFSQKHIISVSRIAFFDFDMSSQNWEFSSALILEAISIDELGLIAL